MSSQTADRPGVDEPRRDLLGVDPKDFVIAYISCPQDAGRSHLGGALFTDWRTRPLEFSFVTPVKVSALQRIIHGKTLEEAIAVELIGGRLLAESTQKPSIVFVDSEILLGLQRNTSVPVARLERREATSDQSLSTVAFTTAKGASVDDRVGSVLAALEPFVDLVEPFTRVTEAIKEAMKSAAGDK